MGFALQRFVPPVLPVLPLGTPAPPGIHQRAYGHMTAIDTTDPVARRCFADMPHDRDDTPTNPGPDSSGSPGATGFSSFTTSKEGHKARRARSEFPDTCQKWNPNGVSTRHRSRVGRSRPSISSWLQTHIPVVRDAGAGWRHCTISEENLQRRCPTSGVPCGPAPATACGARCAPFGVWLGPSMGTGMTPAAMRPTSRHPGLPSADCRPLGHASVTCRSTHSV